MFQPDFMVFDRNVRQGKSSLWNTSPALYYARGTVALLNNVEIFYLPSPFIFSCSVIISQDFIWAASFVAWQQGTFTDKSLLLFQDGIFLCSCNSLRTDVRYI